MPRVWPDFTSCCGCCFRFLLAAVCVTLPEGDIGTARSCEFGRLDIGPAAVVRELPISRAVLREAAIETARGAPTIKQLSRPDDEFASHSTTVEPLKMTIRVYDETFDGQTIDLAMGQTIEIRLRENPTTGFRWRLMNSEPVVCEMTTDTFKQESGRVGHGGEHSWVFKAVRSGDCDIEFRYQRPWANVAPPERRLRIFIHVENPDHGPDSDH